MLSIPIDVLPLWRWTITRRSVHRYFANTPFKGAKHLVLGSVSPRFGTLPDAWDIKRILDAIGYLCLRDLDILIDDGSISSPRGSPALAMELEYFDHPCGFMVLPVGCSLWESSVLVFALPLPMYANACR